MKFLKIFCVLFAALVCLGGINAAGAAGIDAAELLEYGVLLERLETYYPEAKLLYIQYDDALDNAIAINDHDKIYLVKTNLDGLKLSCSYKMALAKSAADKLHLLQSQKPTDEINALAARFDDIYNLFGFLVSKIDSSLAKAIAAEDRRGDNDDNSYNDAANSIDLPKEDGRGGQPRDTDNGEDEDNENNENEADDEAEAMDDEQHVEMLESRYDDLYDDFEDLEDELEDAKADNDGAKANWALDDLEELKEDVKDLIDDIDELKETIGDDVLYEALSELKKDAKNLKDDIAELIEEGFDPAVSVVAGEEASDEENEELSGNENLAKQGDSSVEVVELGQERNELGLGAELGGAGADASADSAYKVKLSSAADQPASSSSFRESKGYVMLLVLGILVVLALILLVFGFLVV